MKRLQTLVMMMALVLQMSATDYYLSTTGSDLNSGESREQAFATLGAAQKVVKAGDRVFILPGTYAIGEEQISKEESSGPYKVVFNLTQKGKAGAPISFIGLTEDGQRPVFDFSGVNPAGYRITAFLVSGQYLLFRNFEVVGLQVNISSHTQSENIRVTDGSYCTFDHIACHDGMGIGFYLTRRSHHNLFLNCDGYNNYDPVSEKGAGGQNDGFGCHVLAGQTDNVFIGCRAWNNSDDGYDLINCYSPVTFCYSIAWHNGYDADGNRRQDGNGFKAGGYGMSSAVSITDVPRHVVHHCLAVQNKSNGIYANHHLGGITVSYNTSSGNGSYNYSMVNRAGTGKDAIVDVDGYDHVLDHNLSVHGSGRHVTALNGGDGQNTLDDNSFIWGDNAWTNTDMDGSNFESTNTSRLIRERKSDGMLNASTTLTYMRQKEYVGYGVDFSDYEQAVVEMKKTTGAEVTASTAITTPSVQTVVQGDVYDLNGRKVTEGLRRHQLYIRNHKKYVVK